VAGNTLDLWGGMGFNMGACWRTFADKKIKGLIGLQVAGDWWGMERTVAHWLDDLVLHMAPPSVAALQFPASPSSGMTTCSPGMEGGETGAAEVRGCQHRIPARAPAGR